MYLNSHSNVSKLRGNEAAQLFGLVLVRTIAIILVRFDGLSSRTMVAGYQRIVADLCIESALLIVM